MALAKSDIVQVSPIIADNVSKRYDSPAYTWVYLEEYMKHHHTADNVKSSHATKDALFPKMGRTRVKMLRYEDGYHPSDYRLVPTNDNTYAEVKLDVSSKVVAYVWDKPTLTKNMNIIVDKFTENIAKHPIDHLDNTHLVFLTSRAFILYLQENYAFPPGSVVVRLDNIPTLLESYRFQAYAPVMGYWTSPPTLVRKPYGPGYNMEITLHNKKTEMCSEFLEWEHITKGGIFMSGGGEIRLRLEETDAPVNFFDISINYPPTTTYLLCDCEWLIKTTEFHPMTESVVVERAFRDKPLTSLKRDSFKEELVMKVFHPDRVARLMGDTWGTEESWLNQI